MNDNYLPPSGGVSKIIKKENQRMASVVFGSVVKHRVLEAEGKARSILLDARQEALELINAAAEEAAAIRQSAYEAGREEAQSEMLENLLETRDERSRALSGVEEEVLKLSVKLAEKIIGRAVEQDESIRAEIVFSAVRQARQQEMLTVRVNANDLPLLERMRERIDAFGRTRYVDFVADQAVARGGCIIESASGTIDARVETQLRVLENALLARASAEERKS